jgi:hypothetical protein
MSSFTNMLIIVIMIQLVMLMFGVSDVPGTALYTFISAPSDWDNAAWNLLFADVITAASITVIIIGTFVYKADWLLFAGVVGVLYSFGKPLVSFFNLIKENSSPELAILIVGPIILLYIMLLIGWWRGRNA